MTDDDQVKELPTVIDRLASPYREPEPSPIELHKLFNTPPYLRTESCVLPMSAFRRLALEKATGREENAE